jgi:O-antigen/teichoic acid export membrane protein
MLLGLISFPILTRLLTTEEYGIIGLVSSTMFFVVAIAKGGLADGLTRLYKEYSETTEKLTVFSSTVVIRGLILSVITVLLYVTAFPLINNYLSIKDGYVIYFMIMAVYLFIRPLNIIVFGILRVTGRTIFFNVINLIGRIISIGLSIFLFIYLIKQFYSYFLGIIIAELIVSIVLFYWFFSNYKVNIRMISGKLATELSKFGLPLLITELSYLLLSYADRYMIVAYKGEGDLGLYSVGYNMASYISDIIMFSLSYAVIPIYVGIYHEEGKEKTEEFLKRCLHYLLIAIIPMFFGYLAVSDDLFVTLASKKYAAASVFSPIILLGSLFLGMNNIFNAGLYLKKKTKTILTIMLSAVIINIILNFYLLPEYGIIGAAWATLVACAFASVLTIFLSYRYIIIRIDIRNILYYIILSGIMYLAVRQIEATVVWINLILKIITGMFIIASGILFKEKEIRLKIKQLILLKAQ